MFQISFPIVNTIQWQQDDHSCDLSTFEEFIAEFMTVITSMVRNNTWPPSSAGIGGMFMKAARIMNNNPVIAQNLFQSRYRHKLLRYQLVPAKNHSFFFSRKICFNPLMLEVMASIASELRIRLQNQESIICHRIGKPKVAPVSNANHSGIIHHRLYHQCICSTKPLGVIGFDLFSLIILRQLSIEKARIPLTA